MTSRTDFTDEEWQRLRPAPLVPRPALSFSPPPGPHQGAHENKTSPPPARPTAAERKPTPPPPPALEAAGPADPGGSAQPPAKAAADRPPTRHNPMSGFKPRGADARREIEDEMRAVNALLVEKTTPEEADQFREWLKASAQATALAAKEGGFLGFRAERVSEGEQQMLERLGEIFGQGG